MLSNENLKNTNYTNFNTNIDDYTIDELYNLLELDEMSRENILLKIHDLTSNTFKNNEPIKNFFLQVQNKLLTYLSEFNNNLDNTIHNNANSNIEVNNESNYNTNNESDYDTNNESDYEEINENKNNTKESFVDYSTFKETTTESGAKIEEYNIYKNLYFNTIYRTDKSALSTDCRITLTNPLTNVIQCKLASINMKKPFLIHNTKNNNTFIIKRYNINNICDFSLIIENGYYEDKIEIENYLNNYFINYTNTIRSEQEFVNNLRFSINNNTKKSKLDLSSVYLTSDNSNNFNYFTLDFKSNYIFPYSLATILGFDANASNNYYTSGSSLNPYNNLEINSPKTYCTLNNPLYFCFDDFQNTTIETHQLFLKNNVSSDKILAKINTHNANIYSNYYIYEVLDNTDNKNNIRRYSGNVNLSDFNIKIIDSYGNLVESIDEDFTFELEIIKHEKKIQQTNSQQTNIQ